MDNNETPIVDDVTPEATSSDLANVAFLALAASAVVALGAGVWFGWKAVESHIATKAIAEYQLELESSKKNEKK